MMKIWRSFDHFHLIFHHQMGSLISHCIIYEFTKIITSKLINIKKCDKIWRCPLVCHQPTYFTNLGKKTTALKVSMIQTKHLMELLLEASLGSRIYSLEKKATLLIILDQEARHMTRTSGKPFASSPRSTDSHMTMKTSDKTFPSSTKSMDSHMTTRTFRQTFASLPKSMDSHMTTRTFRQNLCIITQKHGFSHDHQDFQAKPLHHHPKAWILTIHVQLQFGNLLGVPHNSMNMLIVCCTKQITTN